MATRVYFVQPADGVTVSNPVHLVFGVEGDMALRPAGDMTPNTGHFAVITDGDPVPQGQIVPNSGGSQQYSQAQTQGDIALPSGQHTLTLQFCDGAYRSYGPDVSTTITINVG